MPRHLADTPARHVRRALRLLEELEDELRHPASSMLGQHERVGLVVAARRRLRLAAAALGSADPCRKGVLRKLAPASAIVVNGVLLGIGGAVFLLRSVSRFTGGVLRLILTLRRI